MDLKKYIQLSEVARGSRKADLVLKDLNVINVFTEEVYQEDIAISDGIIVGIGRYEGEEEISMSGRYACPGFIDSHLHLESTLVTPGELIHQAALCGTTTFIVDPHEAANVSGTDGIDYILDQTQDVPANVYVMMPSCVPATDIDDNGFKLTADKMLPYMDNDRILGLGELMDYVSVINGDKEMHHKLDLFKNRIKDGHAPSLDEGDLSAYVLAGITTDHECTSFEYAMEERRRGVTILIREGSAAKNLEAIVTGIVANDINTEGFCFCTDDKHIEEIQDKGHINYNVKKAVRLGIDVIKAIKMATIQPAKTYGLNNLGALAPGYQADIIIMDNLEDLNVLEVYYKGKKISKDQKYEIKACPDNLKNTVNLKHFSKEDLQLEKTNKPFHVIQMIEGQIITKELILDDIPGEKYFEPNATYKKIAAIERHKNTGKVGVGVLTGFGITGGAIASSVSHDSHNIIVIGDNDHDMALAVNELIRSQGGYTIVEAGKVYETLELSIMGLISDAGYEYVNRTLGKMIKKAQEMGVSEKIDPFISLSFMALPVLPEIRITPRGLYNVLENKLIDEGED